MWDRPILILRPRKFTRPPLYVYYSRTFSLNAPLRCCSAPSSLRLDYITVSGFQYIATTAGVPDRKGIRRCTITYGCSRHLSFQLAGFHVGQGIGCGMGSGMGSGGGGGGDL